MLLFCDLLRKLLAVALLSSAQLVSLTSPPLNIPAQPLYLFYPSTQRRNNIPPSLPTCPQSSPDAIRNLFFYILLYTCNAMYKYIFTIFTIFFNRLSDCLQSVVFRLRRRNNRNLCSKTFQECEAG